MTYPSVTIDNLARARLNLSLVESRHFKVAPQIPLEVLLVLSANQGSARLSELYERVRATQSAVRLHLRSLALSDLVEEGVEPADRRARRILLTPKGVVSVDRYAEDTIRLISRFCQECDAGRTAE
jgi:DNA-binding MarR family transcriptional regulator